MKRHLGLFNSPPYLNLLKAFMLIAFCTSIIPNNTLRAGGSLCEADCQHLGETEEDGEVEVSQLSAGYFNSCTWVYGTLNIDQTTTILDAKIVMMPGSKILVKDGYTLQLEDCHLFGCDTLWQGIFVEGGARLIARNDTIEDANTAIFLEDGAFVEANTCRFENNYIGIATGLPTNATSSPKTVSGFMAGNKFVCSEDMLIPYEGHVLLPRLAKRPKYSL